jgi:hypothetical protein
MTAAAGVPLRPLAVLVAGVLGAHALLLRGMPASIDGRHLQGALTFSVRDVQTPPAADVQVLSPAPSPAAEATNRGAQPAPARAPAPRVVRESPQPATMPAPALPLLPAPRLAPASVWHYAVTSMTRGAVRNGTAQLAWRPAGASYEAALRIDVPGGITRRQASEGALGPSGIEPQRFSERVRSEEATHFDRAQGRITFSSNRPDALLQPGAQDRLSVLLQVAAIVASDPSRFGPGASVTLQAATTREAIEWTFTVDGEEQLAMPGGTVTALKLTRAPQRDYDLRIEVWLAPGGDYGPVRLRLTPPNGDWLDMQWSGTDKG